MPGGLAASFGIVIRPTRPARINGRIGVQSGTAGVPESRMSRKTCPFCRHPERSGSPDSTILSKLRSRSSSLARPQNRPFVGHLSVVPAPIPVTTVRPAMRLRDSVRLALLFLVACFGVATVNSGHASAEGQLMPLELAAQLGLEQSWRQQLSVPAGSQSLVQQKLHVHSGGAVSFAEVVAEDGRIVSRIGYDQINHRGQPIGQAEAERLARQEIRVLAARGITATQKPAAYARIRIYTLSDDGSLECRDAETGEQVWLVRVGNRFLGYAGLGVSEQFISVTNGANLLKIDAANGELMQSERTMGAPLFGSVNTTKYAVIASSNGSMEGYSLDDPSRYPFRELVSGSALSMPVKSPDSDKIAWGTDRGFVYVMELAGEPSVQFRLNTDGIVSGPLAAASGERFFFGSDGGMVYALRATRTGSVMWSRPFGEPFYTRPFVSGDKLLIRSIYGNLLALSTVDGSSQWDLPAPGVNEILSVFGDRVYATTTSGSMAVVDLNSGKPIAQLHDVHPGHLLPNTLTNRLYLVDSRGSMQCLRPANSEMPIITDAPDIAPAETVAPEPESAAATEMPAEEPNPFGAQPDADPFGASGADPFGTDDEMVDPFGGTDGNDPFDGF